MRHRAFFFAAVCAGALAACAAGAGDEPKAEDAPAATVKFASLDEAQGILGAKDEYIKAMGPFDRSARMKTDKEVGVDEFLVFVKKQAREWTDGEKKRITRLVDSLKDEIGKLKPGLLATAVLVKTTGEEDGGAAYTRGEAVILPQNMVDLRDARLRSVIAHELFHLLTRRNPALRDELYRVIGFEPCGPVELPEELKSRQITNPDALVNAHCATVKVKGESVEVVPVIFLGSERFDPEKTDCFLDDLEIKLLVVEKAGDRRQAKRVDGKPVLLDPRRVPSFLAKVGLNTPDLMHPEEILADNFALMLVGEKDVPSPKIIEGVRKIVCR